MCWLFLGAYGRTRTIGSLLSAMFVCSMCVSGVDLPTCGGWGSFSKFVRFLRGASLCGDTSFN